MGTSELVQIVVAAAKRYGLSPSIAVAQIDAESSWKACARSGAGALGLAQFMPATGRAYGLKYPDDFCNPTRAMDAWGRFMRELLDEFGRYDHALAAYNAGPGRVRSAGGVPNISETKRYVAKVLDNASNGYASRLISDAGAAVSSPVGLALVLVGLGAFGWYVAREWR